MSIFTNHDACCVPSTGTWNVVTFLPDYADHWV
jgi:hypothetical protein